MFEIGHVFLSNAPSVFCLCTLLKTKFRLAMLLFSSPLLHHVESSQWFTDGLDLFLVEPVFLVKKTKNPKR